VLLAYVRFQVNLDPLSEDTQQLLDQIKAHRGYIALGMLGASEVIYFWCSKREVMSQIRDHDAGRQFVFKVVDGMGVLDRKTIPPE
jgi:hypothetical protein